MKFLRLVLLSLLSSVIAFAQFGGATGEAVVYLVSTKGNQTFQVMPAGTTNTAAVTSRFQVIADPLSLPNDPPPGFPMLQIYFMHRDSDDVFQMIVQDDVVAVPHHQYLTTFKIFVIKGSRRDYGDDTEAPRDFTSNTYTTFLKDADLGPNLSMNGPLYVLGWSPTDLRPPFLPTPRNTRGPSVPPGKTGTQFAIDQAVIPPFEPWTPVRLKYPNRLWKDGIFVKFLETDPVAGNTTQVLRMVPGRSTPLMKIQGNTHFYVLQGNLVLTPVNGSPVTLPPNSYVYLPDGFSFTLSNPRTQFIFGQ